MAYKTLWLSKAFEPKKERLLETPSRLLTIILWSNSQYCPFVPQISSHDQIGEIQ